MLMPEPGPFGETFFEASWRAIVSGAFVNRPSEGYVDSVLTFDTHLRLALDAFFPVPLFGDLVSFSGDLAMSTPRAASVELWLRITLTWMHVFRCVSGRNDHAYLRKPIVVSAFSPPFRSWSFLRRFLANGR